ncbi:TPA: hypothetical protein ACH3X1_012256 [Trebouxia sp. C0004]
MKCYKGTSVIHDVHLRNAKKNQVGPKQHATHLSTNSRPDTKTGPNMLGLLKDIKCALKQQLGGPRNALLCTSEAMFTVSLSENADIHCSTSTVAYERSGCIYVSAA